MSTTKGNVKIAKARGDDWKKKLSKGKLDAQLHPTVIKMVRVNKAVSQADLAKLLKVSLATYGAIERGKRSANLTVARALNKKLGGNLAYFFKETKSKRFLAIAAK
jgi:DNA-binding XRE family transcriptional regulator